MVISENNDIGSALSSPSMKQVTITLRDRAMIATGATVTVVAMAGWLYFLGWIIITTVMWVIG
jgi:hypothetical protein